MGIARTLTTLAVTLVFCLVFLRGRSLHLLGRMGHRTAVSFAGGAAVAYVFMDLSPELQKAATGFRAVTIELALPGPGRGVHLATMLGFLCFYGLDELVIRSRDQTERQRRRELNLPHSLFRVHMVAFAAYAWLVSYLLVRSAEQTVVALMFYAAAMGLHFLSVAHTLREEHGALYDRIGALLLAASCLAGWACGMVFDVPRPVVWVLFGLIAGGVIANTFISELPREKEGRFVPFLMGAAVYTAALFVAGWMGP